MVGEDCTKAFVPAQIIRHFLAHLGRITLKANRVKELILTALNYTFYSKMEEIINRPIWINKICIIIFMV